MKQFGFEISIPLDFLYISSAHKKYEIRKIPMNKFFLLFHIDDEGDIQK